MTQADSTAQWTESFVAAENAPIGVQLWPIVAPGYAHHWTLTSVEVITRTLRDASGTYEYAEVVWTYEDGKARTFNPGEQVLISTEQAV